MPRTLLTTLAMLLLSACFSKGGASEDDDDGPRDGDNDGWDETEDCNDDDASIHPFADEYCDGIDNDCDLVVDENTAVDAERYYLDADSDGFGDADDGVTACERPAGTVSDKTDCDDDDEFIHPDADELCDGIDNNCDEDIDGDDAVDAAAWYNDGDGDGFGDDDDVELACEQIEGRIADGGDCDDDDAAVHPDATEVCGDGDQDCDGLIDDEDPSLDPSGTATFYADGDEDGFGDPDNTRAACSQPDGFVEDASDCDDSEAAINPDASEVCDTLDVDEDCDGSADDNDASTDVAGMAEWYRDADRDGYGAGTASMACDDPSAGATIYLSDDSDCDDANDAINPGADEVCDDADTDEDCDGRSDDDDSSVDAATMERWFLDEDHDGYGSTTAVDACDDPSSGPTAYVDDSSDCDDGDDAINPGETEVCDDADTDEDCDGRSDDDDSSVDAGSYTTWYLDDDGDGWADAGTTTTACEDPTDASDSWTADSSLAADCDDGDDSINPGATETCDDVDNDCDPSTDAAGIAFVSDAGATTDLTATFAAGTSSSPTSYTLSSAGTLNICEDTVYARLTATADVALVGDGSTIDAGGSNPVLTITGSSTDVEIRGLTLRNGGGHGISGSGWGGSWTTYYGGGIYCDEASSVSLENATVSDNDADYGGGVWLEGCDLTMVDSSIDDNAADTYGGGVHAEGGGITITMDGSSISGNSADANYGGGLNHEGGTLVMTDSDFTDNSCSSCRRAGAMLTYVAVTMTDSVFLDNSGQYGSGIFMDGATVTCTATTPGSAGFRGNTGSYSYTGAVHVSGYGAGFTSDGCDFGASGSADDNTPFDVYAAGGAPYYKGDNANFSCDIYSCADD